jgi:predicted ATP-dependent endonuclease of OLD family
MRLQKLKIVSMFKNLEGFEIDFSNKTGITVLIGNNGSGKSNLLEAISSIFAGLYDRKHNPSFDYEISYQKDIYNVEFGFIKGNYYVRFNGKVDNLRIEHLPTQVISSYSGEESRLWDNYYFPFYQEYIKAVRGATVPNTYMTYINKYYWNIALLTLHLHDFGEFTNIRHFCQTTLGIQNFDTVKFTFDIDKLTDWIKPRKNPTIEQLNPVTNFILTLNPDRAEIIEVDLSTLKQRLGYVNEKDVFRYLSASFIPQNDKIITKIEIKYNGGLDADGLSEGEKKFLLLFFILEVLSDSESLLLFDEPDSHIHVSRKEDIQKLFNRQVNRENIITTHSPTLTHKFDFKHITMLSKDENKNVRVEAEEKQEIVHKLTNGIWSLQEQNIFLNSTNDILLVEGKSDETFFKKALEVLKKTKPQYVNLEFEYLPCGGADGVKLMIQKFKPKLGQKIIAFFDSDQAGWNSVNKVFERVDSNKYSSKDFGKYKKKDNIYIAVYPIRPYYKGGKIFNIEDYFRKSLLVKYVLKTFKSIDTIVKKDAVKKSLEKDCNAFSDKEFKYFTTVFDLIIEIKNEQ